MTHTSPRSSYTGCLSLVAFSTSYVGYIDVWWHCTILLCESKESPPLWPAVFLHFPQTVEYFKSIFTRLLCVPIYGRLQIFIQLSPPVTKLCHIKRDYLVHIICSKCPPSAETHACRHLRKLSNLDLVVMTENWYPKSTPRNFIKTATSSLILLLFHVSTGLSIGLSLQHVAFWQRRIKRILLLFFKTR